MIRVSGAGLWAMALAAPWLSCASDSTSPAVDTVASPEVDATETSGTACVAVSGRRFHGESRLCLGEEEPLGCVVGGGPTVRPDDCAVPPS